MSRVIDLRGPRTEEDIQYVEEFRRRNQIDQIPTEQDNDIPKWHVNRRSMKRRVWDKTVGKCVYCGRQTSPLDDFQIDHYVSVSKGGRNTIENLVPACRSCNGQKYNRTLEQFRQHIRKKSQPSFTDEQTGFLKKYNPGLVIPEPDHHVFWFEQEKIDIGVGEFGSK